MCCWKGRTREYGTFFVTSLSCRAGGDMTGCSGIAGPGFLVNALAWVQIVPSTQVREEVQVQVIWGETRDTLPPEPQFLPCLVLALQAQHGAGSLPSCRCQLPNARATRRWPSEGGIGIHFPTVN